jgi:hypothetical protein
MSAAPPPKGIFAVRTALALPLPVLLMLLATVLAPSVMAAAAAQPDPPADLNGESFAIVFLTEKGKPKDKLVFGPEGATCQALGEKPVKVSYVGKKKQKSVEFSGKFTDAKGAVIELTGSVSGPDVHGTITIRPKDDDATARNFTGQRVGGGPEPKKK